MNVKLGVEDGSIVLDGAEEPGEAGQKGGDVNE